MHKISLKWKPVILHFGKKQATEKNPKRCNLTEKQKGSYKSKNLWIGPELVEGTHAQLFQNILNNFVQRNHSIDNLVAAPQPHHRMSPKEFKCHCQRKPGNGERWGSADFPNFFNI